MDFSDEDVNDVDDSFDMGLTCHDDDGEAYSFSDDDSKQLLSSRDQNYTILTEADVEKFLQEDVTTLSNTLSISRTDSSMILRHYNWNPTNVLEEWFSDERKVRNLVGLSENPTDQAPDSTQLICAICFDSYSPWEMSSANCGHLFCIGCWRSYISMAISDGPGCLTLRCPDTSCAAAVGQDLVDSLVSEDDKGKYSHFLLRSYIEENRKIKFCPGPGCDFAVRFDGGSTDYDVSCRCGHVFCWNCTEEAHRPVACETVAKWILKNSAESENANWILANSKPCPKCHRPIEKNHGCNHMKCRLCGLDFCWLCLCALSDHRGCNGYEKTKQKREGIDEEEKRRKRAKVSLERYTHYWERWASNQKSLRKATVDLQTIRTEKLDRLRAKLSLPVSQLNFVIEAWEQIVKCRRILTWTYAYGYYFPENEHAKRDLFQYLQGEAEVGLERLHKCAEIDLNAYFVSETLSVTSQEFNDFRSKLARLTTVTRNYFENLVRALENGLQEVDSMASGSRKGADRIAPYGGIITYADFADFARCQDEHWACKVCTYVNRRHNDRCRVCDNHR